MTKASCAKKASRQPKEVAQAPLTLGWYDSCDADASGSEKALVRLLPPSGEGELQLCGHHFRKLERTLVAAQGWKIDQDIRHILTDNT